MGNVEKFGSLFCGMLKNGSLGNMWKLSVPKWRKRVLLCLRKTRFFMDFHWEKARLFGYTEGRFCFDERLEFRNVLFCLNTADQ